MRDIVPYAYQSGFSGSLKTIIEQHPVMVDIRSLLTEKLITLSKYNETTLQTSNANELSLSAQLRCIVSTNNRRTSFKHCHGLGKIQIFIKRSSGSTMSINTDENSTIDEIKLVIYSSEGIPPNQQRLLLGCRELSKGSRFIEFAAGDTITLLVRLLGGVKRRAKVISAPAPILPSRRPAQSCLPFRYWFGFGRSYQEGRVGEEGRIVHVLCECQFAHQVPPNWFSDQHLKDWSGVTLIKNCDNVTLGIKELWLNFSSVKRVSRLVGNLTTLTRLVISSGQLTVLPNSIGSLSCLTYLCIGASKLTALPESIGNLSSLAELIIYHANLSCLPNSIGNLTQLATLHIERNSSLTSLPESIGNLSSLTLARFDRNQLRTLPNSIGQLSSLDYIDLSHNQLIMLPESIGNLSHLGNLSLSDNQLTVLPESIGNLSSLSEINLSENQLIMLPESIGNLSSLNFIELSHNQLTVLPESIGNLSHLTRLCLDKNRLTTLPESIRNLACLNYLGLRNTPIALDKMMKKKAYKQFDRVGLNIDLSVV